MGKYLQANAHKFISTTNGVLWKQMIYFLKKKKYMRETHTYIFPINGPWWIRHSLLNANFCTLCIKPPPPPPQSSHSVCFWTFFFSRATRHSHIYAAHKKIVGLDKNFNNNNNNNNIDSMCVALTHSAFSREVVEGGKERQRDLVHMPH
jgi:hypothetical protein